MLFHETFIRCPECKNAYFRKNVHVTLNAEAFSKDVIQEEKTTTEYICNKCGHLLKQVVEERRD